MRKTKRKKNKREVTNEKKEMWKEKKLMNANKEKKTENMYVWYMHLKIENCCLKTCVEIRVDEKVCENMCNAV